MLNILRKNLNDGIKGTLAGLFITCLIFGLSVRTGGEPSFIQHCLAVISDHYYLLYFMLPLFLLLCFFIIEDDSEAVILRYKTYFRYFINKWLSLTVISFIFMAAQLLAIAISGVGLPISNDWMIADSSIMHELFTILSSFFASPTSCFAVVSAYMMMGLCVIAMILMWMGHFLSKSWSIKIIISLYLLSVMSMRIRFIRELPITLFNHIVILHHNLSSSYRLIITAATSVMIVCLILWTVKKYWNRRLFFIKKQAKGITPYYCKEVISRRNIIILGAIVASIVAWKYLQSGGDIDGEEWIAGIFAGHGTGSFYVLSFIEMLLLNGTPIYLLVAFIEKSTTEHSAFITIRLIKRKNILVGILMSALLFILLYGVFLAVLPLIGLSFIGLPINSDILALLFLSVGMKLLDILAQALFIIIIYCLTGQITIGFVGYIAVNFLCIAPFSFIKILPFGISSLSRINMPQIGAEGIASHYVALILLATNALFIGWLFTTGYKHLPKN